MSENVVRCAAITKAGTQCKNYARPGSAYCHLHHDQATAVAQNTASVARLQDLVTELDGLVADLKTTLTKEAPKDPAMSDYPLRLVGVVRENLSRFSPDVQLGILEGFEGMTVEDLTDLDTWKGMAYMFAYSARFQAGQVRERVNQRLPEALQPEAMLRFVRSHVDRFAPEVAKDLMNSLEGASKEDLLDPDTWKGMFYMLNYSVQFQAEQLKQRLVGEGDAAGEEE
ncbi:MAG: hypothetical protein H6659_09300 [Ardenticatenaceae bacterium]|nr:hypothetical protein [Ardenticatenaceae bacterium]MCB8987228.1 hypothetical protein [Ardenticatenaceae bacterium]